MDLNALNQSVLRLIENGTKIISFLKDFTVGSAKDVSITYINADGSTSVSTFANIAKLDGQVEAQIKSLEDWRNTLFSQSGGVNLYKNSRFLTLNDSGTHPVGFGHYYSHGKPVYSILSPDFNATDGDRKIAADLVRMVGQDSWYPTKFNVLKVVCQGTKDTTARHWTLNQTVNIGNVPLTRGCYIYVKQSSVSKQNIRFSISDNPSGANSGIDNTSNKAVLIMGRGKSGGHYLGFNVNVMVNDVSSNETIEFFIVAPFFVEGYVDGYRTSPIDIDKA